jgi:hypothetical protein
MPLPTFDHVSGQPLSTVALAPWMVQVHRIALHHAARMNGDESDETHSKCFDTAINGNEADDEWYIMSDDEKEFVKLISAALNIVESHLNS